MTYTAIGTGPVVFLDSNQSQQAIPLSAISFGTSGVTAGGWPKTGVADQPIVAALLAQLVAEGLLTQGTQAAAAPSLSITATQTGPAGNEIMVTFSNISTTAGTFTVAVTANEVYPALTVATLGAVLGTSAATAAGLVFQTGPTGEAPAAFTGTLSAAAPFKVDVPAADATVSFTVEAADPIADAANIQIAVAPDPAPRTTFTLTASWTKTVPALTLAALTAANPFGLLVTFTVPAGAALPAAGSVTLAGGAAASAVTASAAKATVLSA